MDHHNNDRALRRQQRQRGLGVVDDDTDHDVHTVMSGDDENTLPIPSASVSDSRASNSRRLANGDSTAVVRYADNAVVEARHRFQVDMHAANRFLREQDTELALRQFERPPDERRQKSFRGGHPLPQLFGNAPYLRVGLTLLQGADKPQVNHLEGEAMKRKMEPDQKEAKWRFNTAVSLLTDFHVGSQDLLFVEVDRTQEIAKEVQTRRMKKTIASRKDGLRRDNRDAAVNYTDRGTSTDTVTIDSHCVKIVHDLRGGEWDLQSTLIEIDEYSFIRLITDFRHLISRTGPDMTYAETKTVLEKMIECARLLCVRSPILFRMSTRRYISHSKNTRYGIHHESLFRTLYTSKGIKDIIYLGASYFNSLDPSGSGDQTQRMIRPKFLQMVVLLLLLLNDDDLLEIKDFLESTYKLKADRSHLEMVFLKVIPLMSINPQVFLEALIHTVDGINPFVPDGKQPIGQSDANLSEWWDIFIQRRVIEGYLVPGVVEDLGRETRSWGIKWSEQNGFKSSAIFNNLQYAKPGCNLRAINEISPIELHPEASLDEVAVALTDSRQFNVHPDDVEPMTLLVPGSYAVTEARQDGRPYDRNYDLIVYESVINEDLEEAVKTVNAVVEEYNRFLSVPVKRSTLKRMFTSKEMEPQFLEPLLRSLPITRNEACLGDVKLASVYKTTGRIITPLDVVSVFGRDIQRLSAAILDIKHRRGEFFITSNDHKRFTQAMDKVEGLIGRLQIARQQIRGAAPMSDNPISRIIYPNGWNPKEDPIWFDYEARYTQNDLLLAIEGQRSTVTRVLWQTETLVEVSLQQNQHPHPYCVTPLRDVQEGVKGDEVRVGDIAVLAGQYMIIATHGNDGKPTYVMENCLRIVSVAAQNQSRRGANRSRGIEAGKVVTQFR